MNGRYRLVARIGSGTVDAVYLADDVRLRRRVAVKVFDESLGSEAAFVQRFRTEVRAAAALRHPHIVVIHDWGVDGEVFVVSEYLENGSLRRLLDRGVRLEPAQALQLGLAAARALSFAHGQGVVHRDLRPTNLLFTGDGRLRIADFGIARAVAEAASTEPMGAGGVSARYASPEAAQGNRVDGKADVYALALMLVEAVTGELPFAADTALATLMARIGQPLVVPEALDALQGPLARAGATEVVERIDASELVTALMAVAGDLPEPGPLPFTDPVDGTGEVADLEDITVVVAPGEVAVPTDAPEPAEAPVPANASVAAGMSVVGDAPEPGEAPGSEPPSGTTSRKDTRGSGTADGAGEDPLDDRRRQKNRRRWRIAWSVLALVIVLGGGAVAGAVYLAHRTPTHLVPSVSGATPAVAKARLERLGFTVATRRVRRDGTHAGGLLGVDPSPGTRIAEGHTVTLVVSAGQTLVDVPRDLAGMTEAAAADRLRSVGLTVAAPQKKYSEDVPQGQVLATAAGTPKRLEKGSPVTLQVSEGPKPRVLPDVSGMTPDQAVAALERIGLQPQVTKRLDTKVDTGGLIGLDPSPGTSVPRGSTVQVIVSKGLLVAVPSLAGVDTVPAAIAKLQAAGLVAANLTGTGNLSGKPVAFDPPSGQLVAKGSSVNIVVK